MSNKNLNEDIYYISNYSEKAPFFIIIAGITYPDPTYRVSRNNSRVLTIEYILEGKGTIILDGKEYHVKKGDVYLLPPDSNHLYYSDSKEPWKKIWFNASGPLIKAILQAYSMMDTAVVENVNALEYFERVLQLCNSGKTKLQINNEASIIYHELIIYLKDFIKNDIPKISHDAYTIKEYIDKNINKNVTTEMLADTIYKSKSQTIRIFKKTFGITPYEYLLNCRFSEAKALLANTNLYIKEIAYMCGFSDEHYFSDLFKKKCGTPPKAYRRNHNI